jgi:endonuclease/exonuclease/phosphatase (EEP) superfamily protein YafD
MKSPTLYSLGAVVSIGIAGALLAQTSSAPPVPQNPAARGRQATVAFWNIRWFPGGRPNAYRGEEQKQIRAVHGDIVKLNADVIGFEEVRDWENAALAVQPLADFKVDVCSTFPPREGQTETQNVAIVSRLDPMSAWFEMWKAGAAITPPRGFAFAAYQLAPKQLLLVYALHVKSNRGELTEDIAIREESARQLSEHMVAMNKAYSPLGAIAWVVGGDFNTAPDDSRYQAEKTTKTLVSLGLKWCWENIPLANRVTLPPDKRFPAACFDHVYYRGATLRKAEVIPTAEASSDHRAVRAEFTLP